MLQKVNLMWNLTGVFLFLSGIMLADKKAEYICHKCWEKG